MTDEDWDQGFAKSMAVFLDGTALDAPDQRGERVVDDSFVVLFNAHHEPLEFTMPDIAGDGGRVVIDTAVGLVDDGALLATRSSSLKVEARSLIVVQFGRGD